MIHELLAELLPRWLAIALRIRRVSPGRRRPSRRVVVPELDTGGAFRAAWREQDPAVDPKEPYGSESSSTGSDHGWANCTMTAGALAIAYQQPRGDLAPWGGDMRHRQGDLSGGTDLYDLRDAWAEYGEELKIKSGSGWAALVDAHGAGRAVVVQGTGNVPGSESFDGGHACAIAPETHSDGRWLFGDPLASGWQWVKPADIRSWAERWQSSIAFAVGEAPPAEPVPQEPTASTCALPGPELARASALAYELALDESVGLWVDYLGPVGPVAGGVWDVSIWVGAHESSIAWLLEGCDDPSAVWGRGPVPDPAAAARHALDTPPTWDALAWRALLWR